MRFTLTADQVVSLVRGEAVLLDTEGDPVDIKIHDGVLDRLAVDDVVASIGPTSHDLAIHNSRLGVTNTNPTG